MTSGDLENEVAPPKVDMFDALLQFRFILFNFYMCKTDNPGPNSCRLRQCCIQLTANQSKPIYSPRRWCVGRRNYSSLNMARQVFPLFVKGLKVMTEVFILTV